MPSSVKTRVVPIKLKPNTSVGHFKKALGPLILENHKLKNHHQVGITDIIAFGETQNGSSLQHQNRTLYGLDLYAWATGAVNHAKH